MYVFTLYPLLIMITAVNPWNSTFNFGCQEKKTTKIALKLVLAWVLERRALSNGPVKIGRKYGRGSNNVLVQLLNRQSPISVRHSPYFSKKFLLNIIQIFRFFHIARYAKEFSATYQQYCMKIDTSEQLCTNLMNQKIRENLCKVARIVPTFTWVAHS